MGLAIFLLLILAIAFALIKFLPLKLAGIIIALMAILITLGICVVKPQMHKPFSIDVIEYFIKINDDGSMTTTKQTTKTILRKDVK
ncbi:hypothetical protein IJ541_06020 [bacterium]|nr:hypothetical protein [bacterium]